MTLHRPNGDVLFAKTMEVSGDLKNGIIENFHAIMADRSRFAAQTATLENDETMTLERAVYSPCQQCKDDPTRPLLWQIKAVRVIHDRVNKVVEYEDAWLEFAGVPILYSPYLTHPDPTVKRKSGLLPVRMGGSSDLGMVARVPYYYVIDEHSDMTLTPIIATDENGGVAGEYRERFTKGEVNVNGSLAYDSQSRTLGHIDVNSRFNINDDWRWGMDVNRASSDTYMRRYGFGNDTTLTSQAYIEGFRGNNYANVSTMAFQGLRATDIASNTPIVLPMAQFEHQGEANRYGAYTTFNANMAMLTRTEGTDTKRISIKPSWNLPYIAPKGDIYKLSASLGVDFFNSTDLIVPANRGGIMSGSALRVTPELAFDWRWPFASRTGTVTQMIEPIGQFIISPYGGNSYKMANEDSLDIDFNDTNLFSTNRYTGYDRVESGPRANYGLKWGIYGDQGGATSVMVGQSYRVAND
ncbi:MAG: LPS-assembly protein LptD, partial [Sphingomonadales bacterium]|nr:LPS-assembly protein LptD [Sphingomonadales bacterium]